MRRLAASDLLPERAGQPVKAWVHVSLADLPRLDGGSALLEQWTARVRARWAARRAGASEGGGDGAWLDGDAAGAIACDAAMAPVVTGEVNVDAFDELVRLCVLRDRHRRGTGGPGTGDHDGTGRGDTNSGDTADGSSSSGRSGGSGSGDGSSSSSDDTGDCGSGSGTGVGSSSSSGGRDGAGRAASPAWEAIERAVIGKAMILLLHSQIAA
jgi:hypothetical protein